jgi:hypothetical protein
MLLNIGNLPKHYKKKDEENPLVEVQKAQNRLNEVVSPVEAARRASECIIKK